VTSKVKKIIKIFSNLKPLENFINFQNNFLKSQNKILGVTGP
jgi:hypothetical protein